MAFGIAPGIIDFKELLKTVSKAPEKQTNEQDFFICGKILSDFLHQADIKSMNSAKSLNNLIPVLVKLGPGRFFCELIYLPRWFNPFTETQEHD